jgi:two-component system, sensor histidine kinase ChiS
MIKIFMKYKNLMNLKSKETLLDSIIIIKSKFMVLLFILYIFLFSLNCKDKYIHISKASKGTVDLRNIEFDKSTTVALDGEWEFYPNKFISYSDISNVTPEYIQVPFAWNQQPKNYTPYPNYGYGSYRLKVSIGNHLEYPTLKLKYIGSAYRIFCNGKEYQNSGIPGIDFHQSIPSLTSEESTLIRNEEGVLDIILHVSNFHISNAGIMRSILLGSNNSIRNQAGSEDTIHWLFTGMILIMGLYHLGIYFLRTKDLSPLYFGMYCVLSSIREFYIIECGINRFFSEINFSYWIKIDQFFLFLSISAFAYYMKSLFPKDTNKPIIRVTAIFHILLSIFLLVSPINYLYIFENLSKITIPLLSFYYLYLIVRVIKNKRDSAFLFLIGFSIVYICIINDLLVSLNLIYSDRLLPYGITLLIFIQSYILSRRFNLALHDAEIFSIQLEKMSKVKDEFMSNLSHEIRTPLSLIYAYSELLKDYMGPEEESIRSYGNDIHREANVLSENINDLMLVTDLETKFKIKEELVQAEYLVKEAVKYLSLFAEEKNISFEYKNLASVCFKSDKSLMIKVFIIIIKNAIVYNNLSGKVIISAEEGSEFIKIFIEDMGPGISEEDLPRIFDKFFRVDSSITYKVSGVGVGLFIAKRILELHSARIKAKSVLGRGTTITLQFPNPKDKK